MSPARSTIVPMVMPMIMPTNASTTAPMTASPTATTHLPVNAAANAPAVETPVSIAGSSGASIGVVTRATRIGEAAVLIVPADGESRTGPGRLHVRLARALALAGIPSLRFDAPDGGDSAPATAAAPLYDEIAIAASRRLLEACPDARIAVLAVGRAGTRAARTWHALSQAGFPLSAACLVDPAIAMARSAPRSFWQRLLGREAILPVDPTDPTDPTHLAHLAHPTGSTSPDGPGADGPDAPIVPDARAVLAPDIEPADSALWQAFPATVKAARSHLLVAMRIDDAANTPLRRLVREDRAWRKAVRRSGGALELDGADAAFTQRAQWEALVAWLTARLDR